MLDEEILERHRLPLFDSIKLLEPGFFLGCDSKYFLSWGRVFISSLRKHAPWASVHVHLFDPTPQAYDYILEHQLPATAENIPEKYSQSIELKKAYYSNVRWIRAIELYRDNVPFVCQDADSIMVKDLSKEVFLKDLEKSWVPVAPKRIHQSLASAAGFGPDQARTIFLKKMQEKLDNLQWADDQLIFDQMINDAQIEKMDLRYTDFKFSDNSYIWTGKGDRKFKEKYQSLVAFYSL